mmetsp:Transcript_17443/g.34212  ORF Transcript_17443/g.34212 Transcript_17443/m.34212 type:complete len:331 (+) Transcript_17443:119-1111(+)
MLNRTPWIGPGDGSKSPVGSQGTPALANEGWRGQHTASAGTPGTPPYASPGLTYLRDGPQTGPPADPTSPSIPTVNRTQSADSGSPPYPPTYHQQSPTARAASNISPPVVPRSPRSTGVYLSPKVGGGSGPADASSPYSSSAEIDVLRELIERYRTEMEVKRGEMNILRSENSALAEEIHNVMLENATLRVEAVDVNDLKNVQAERDRDHEELVKAKRHIMQLESKLHTVSLGLREITKLSTGIKLPSPEQLMRELVVVHVSAPTTPSGSFKNSNSSHSNANTNANNNNNNNNHAKTLRQTTTTTTTRKTVKDLKQANHNKHEALPTEVS